MAVDPDRSDQSHTHAGREYHFCSDACRLAFAADPGRYMRSLSSDDVSVSARARERAAARVTRAYASGRLSRDGFDDRTARVAAARTPADLKAATSDLPRTRRPFSALWRLMGR
jgi:YHS domain-containing protein